MYNVESWTCLTLQMDGDEIEIDLTEEDMKLQQEVTDQTVPEKAAALCAESSPGQPIKP